MTHSWRTPAPTALTALTLLAGCADRLEAQRWPSTGRLDSLAPAHPCPGGVAAPDRRTGDVRLSRRERCALLSIAWAAPGRPRGTTYARTSIRALRGLVARTGSSSWYWAVCLESSGRGLDHQVYVDATSGRVREADVPKPCGDPAYHH